MKRNKTFIFTKILISLFIIGTVIMLLLVYCNSKSKFAAKFGMGYLYLFFFLIIYVPIITILNSRKLKAEVKKKKIIRFLFIFILFGSANFILDWSFRTSKVDLYREFSIAFGAAFGITFMDVTLFKKKEE